MKKNTIKTIFIASLVLWVLTSLTITCSNSAGGGGGNGDEDANLTGIWFVQWDSENPYQYTEVAENLADAFILEIGETDIKAVFYLNSEQVGGFKGTYAVNGDEIVVDVSHTWNDEDYWLETEEETVDNLTYSLNGSNLLVTGQDPLETIIEMGKKVFSVKPEYSVAWQWLSDGESSPMQLELNSDGTCNNYSGDAITLSGIWDASDDFLRITSTEGDEEIYGYLFNFYESGSSVLLSLSGDIYSKELHDITVNMEKEDPEGNCIISATLIVSEEENLYHSYETDASFEGNNASAALEDASGGEYWISAFIDADGDSVFDNGEYNYNFDHLIIDSDTIITIENGDWDFIPVAH
ncbi:MAG: hypothetical protein RBT69_05265 [Spirochaetia bacterium]|jgi:hypothetical protein|nr:hypothetical protein [Spirochaetia bacterium]